MNANRNSLDLHDEITNMLLINYYVNVGTDSPFYIRPTIAERGHLALMRQHGNEVGLYFLFDKGVMVYIGVSKKSVYDRIISHLQDKEFDSYFIMTSTNNNGSVDYEILQQCLDSERYLINHFKPRYNCLSEIALKRVTLNDYELSKIEVR
jgi:hypothetical protein